MRVRTAPGAGDLSTQSAVFFRDVMLKLFVLMNHF